MFYYCYSASTINTMRIILSIIIAALIGFSSWKGYELYKLTNETNQVKYDFAEINKINYGLFNIDIWKDKIFAVIQQKASGFNIEKKDLNSFQRQIEDYLYDLHREYIESGKLVEMFMDKNNQDNKLVGLFMGLFKGNIEKQVSNLDFKSRIPGISGQIMKEFEKKIPELKEQITKQVSNMLVQESSSVLEDQRDLIYSQYETDNLKDTNTAIIAMIKAAEDQIGLLIKYILAALGLVLLIIFLGTKAMTFKLAMLWLTISCVTFLGLGLALPMIDLDARLSDVDLKLLGEEIHFDEQVMYFQSKSIIDVTRTLLEGQSWDLKLVGFLILLFSIVLPFMKMLLTTWYLFVERARQSKFIKTVIFYLGKWSMADVFVVAIFMSYIGFYGLLNSQLAGMAGGNSEAVTIETVNYSKLSPGIIFFTLYCLFSIVMSGLIHRRDSRELV